MIRGKKIENNILNKLETWSQSRTVKWTELKPVVPINENRIFRRSFLSVIRVVAAMTKVHFIEGDSFRAKRLFHFFSFFIILASRDIIKMAKRASTKRSERLKYYLLFFFLSRYLYFQRVRINDRWTLLLESHTLLISMPANRISRIPSATSNVFW